MPSHQNLKIKLPAEPKKKDPLSPGKRTAATAKMRETKAKNKAAKAESKAEPAKPESKSNAAAAPANAPAVEEAQPAKKKGPPPMSPGKRAAATAKRLKTLADKKATAEATVAKVLTVRETFVDVHDKVNSLAFSINCHTVAAARGLYVYMSTVIIKNPKGYSSIFEDMEPEADDDESDSESTDEGELSDEQE
jgi:hypothetical protein